MGKPTISAIIPFYNEQHSVARVVKTLISSGLLNEIICVDDGSTDQSKLALKPYAKYITYIQLRENQGKGAAVAAGIKKATSEYVFFCDADLVHFTKTHVKQILTPIYTGASSVVFAVPSTRNDGSYGRHEVFLAGERVYPRKALIPHINRLKGTKGAGGSEVVLNTLFKKKDITIVPLYKLYKPFKISKWSSATALKQYLYSIIGVLQEAGKIEINSVKDLKQLENLVQVDTFEHLILSIKKIQNKQLRQVLEEYYSKYISKYIKKITSPPPTL